MKIWIKVSERTPWVNLKPFSRNPGSAPVHLQNVVFNPYLDNHLSLSIHTCTIGTKNEYITFSPFLKFIQNESIAFSLFLKFIPKKSYSKFIWIIEILLIQI